MGKLNDEKERKFLAFSAPSPNQPESEKIRIRSTEKDDEENILLIPIVGIAEIKIVEPLGLLNLYSFLFLLKIFFSPPNFILNLRPTIQRYFILSPISDSLKVKSKLNQVTFFKLFSPLTPTSDINCFNLGFSDLPNE